MRVQQWKAVRKTHKLIHQRFKSISKQRWKNFCTNEPKVPRLEKNKYTEVEREEITSLREKTEKKNSSGFQLANKKAKQSIMSESPHSWLLLPGSGRMKWDKTRICKLIRSLWTAGEKRWWWWWGSEKINGHSRGRHKGLLKVYCHKH